MQPIDIAHDPLHFAADLLMVRDRARRLVPLDYYRAQRHYLARRTKRDLILKARQLGFSTLIQAELFRLSTTGPESTLTMADKDENTLKLRRITQRFYDSLPPALPKPVRSEDNASITVYPLIGSEVAIATAGSRTSGRASTYTRQHWSEVGYWKDATWIISGALQAVPERGDTWVVAESTGNGTSGWFYTECMKALRGDSDWTLHFYAWWWDEDYYLDLEPGETLTFTDEEKMLIDKHTLAPEQIKWRRKKIRDLGDLFQQEYPEAPEQAFLTSGRGVFTLPATLFYDTAPTAPEDAHEYVMAVDWGQHPDSTAAAVMDSTDYREVALLRTGKRDYDVMVSEVADLGAHWKVKHVIPEWNSIGRVTAKMLVRALQERMGESMPSVKPFDMTNKRKDDLVKLFQQGIHDGLKLLDNPVATHELRIFQARQTATGLWTYSHPDGEHDDTVIARLLANLACYQLRI